ncbi:MAG: hypothetical protein AAFU85_25750 [Planctomycetota bacterium]
MLDTTFVFFVIAALANVIGYESAATVASLIANVLLIAVLACDTSLRVPERAWTRLIARTQTSRS